MYSLIKYLVFCFCIINSTLLVATERVDPLKTFLENFETLQSNFEQTLLNEDGEQLERTVGTLYLEQPGKFHWSYKEPYIQSIISNGETLWVYDEDLEQVTIRHIDSYAMEQTPAAVILGEANLEQHFVQVDMGEIEGFDWIELTPRDLEAQYKNIRIGFDKRQLGMMIISDNLGQTTRIDFSNVSKNSGLSSDLFDFEIPADIDVIDERQLLNDSE